MISVINRFMLIIYVNVPFLQPEDVRKPGFGIDENRLNALKQINKLITIYKKRQAQMTLFVIC